MSRILAIVTVLILFLGVFVFISTGGQAPDDPSNNAAPNNGSGSSSNRDPGTKNKSSDSEKEKPTTNLDSPTRKGPKNIEEAQAAMSSWTGGKAFRIPINTNPPTLDPIQITDVTSHVVAAKLYNQLIRYNHKMELVADLAESMPTWDASDNSYTFKLRKGVKFHNGKEMTSKDVKYSWERLLDPKESKRMQILEGVMGAKEKIKSDGTISDTKGLQAIDDYTFKVVLEKPRPTFLHEIIMVNTAIIPDGAAEAAIKAGGIFRNAPIGTGPFKLLKWEENNRIEMIRNEAYFRGVPPLEKVIFEIIPKPEMRLAKFLNGEYEVCDIPFANLKPLQKDHPELICKNNTFRTNYLGVGMQEVETNGSSKPSFLGKNPLLRQAINAAIDREHIAKVILEGRGIPAQAIVPPGMMGHNKDLKAWEFNTDKAKALIVKAGYPNGKVERELRLYHRDEPDTKKIAVSIQADLKAVGFNIALQALDWSTFLKRVRTTPPDLYYLGWVADFNDADNFLFWLFHSTQWGSAGNNTRYSNKEVDSLLTKARSTMVNAERIQLYHKAEALIVKDIPWCLLYYKTNYILLQPHVRNVRKQLLPLDVDPGLGMVDFSNVYFSNESH